MAVLGLSRGEKKLKKTFQTLKKNIRLREKKNKTKTNK